MNIIQIQDRLKGVDDNALVRYVEQPTSDVPTYLALGELQRREKMRASYQAEAAPTETVSEEIVGKATPQMGIGALTNNMAAPQMPQPEVMSESETITDTGIANLPAPNIGNYAEGGIVGGERDIYDVIIDDYIGPGLDTAGLFAGKYAGPIIGGMWPGEVQAAEKYTPEEMQGIMGYAPGGMVEGLRNSINNPSTLMPGYYLPNRYPKDELPGFLDDPFKIFMGDPQPVEENEDFISEYLGYGKKARKALADKEALEKEAAKPKSQVPSAPVAETKKETTMADRIAEFKSLMGEDKYNDMLVKKMEKMDASAERQAEVAPWMALTEAGLAIAAGQDQNALTNIASGATKGIESYSNSLKEKRALEEQQFEVATKLRQAERAEQIAAIQYGVDSKQFEDTQANKLALANQEAQLKMVLKQMADPKDRASVLTDDVTQTALAEFDKAYANANGDDTIGSPAHIAAKKIYTNQVVQETLSAGQGVGTLDTSGFSMRN
tara:strand:+ start:213 stop:1697 length:1485 start_codon:yes stop_codon:yes gene_type:complete